MNFREDVVVFIWSVVPVGQNHTEDQGARKPYPNKSFVRSFASVEFRGSLSLEVRQSIITSPLLFHERDARRPEWVIDVESSAPVGQRKGCNADEQAVQQEFSSGLS